MANYQDRVTIDTTVNGKQAEDELKRLRQQAIELKEKIAEVYKTQGKSAAYEQLNKDFAKTKRNIVEVQKQLYDVNRTLGNLSSASVRDLKRAYAELNSEIKNGIIERGTKAWDEQQEKIKAVREQLAKVTAEQKKVDTGGSMLDTFNKFSFAISNVGNAFTTIQSKMQQFVVQAAEMDDAYSDVQKTTGMTRDEVVALNEAFQQMDTRTSREKLNELASTAGKLGITGSDDVLRFVEAGNQINVALGEDLGEDAIQQIGKMVGVFGECTDELQGKDLKGQMLAVGSALNELGASSSASEDYLVQFAGRLGGVARQAGISMDQILGFGSALDQDMQQVEMSATAFSTILTKMMSEPAKFAEATGMDVQKFTNLVKTDTNAAMKELLRTLKNSGDFEALTPILAELGLTGTRATGVVTALANSIDKVEAAQTIANQAMAEGVSITNEYDVKNNNLQAQLEKNEKAFKDAAIALGESLAPAFSSAATVSTTLMRSLASTVQWISQNKGICIALTAAWVAYVAAKQKAIIVEKTMAAWHKTSAALQATATVVTKAAAVAYYTLTGATQKAAAAQKALKVAMASTPWGAILAAVSALAVGVYALIKRNGELTASQRAISNINKQTQEEYGEQAAKVQVLNSRLHDERVSIDERRKALQQLRSIIPGYHAELTEEGKLINDNKQAIDQYLKSLEQEIRFKTVKDELEKLYAEKMKQEKVVEEKQTWATSQQKRVDKYSNINPAKGLTVDSQTLAAYTTAARQANRELNKEKDKLAETLEAIKKLEEQYATESNKATVSTTSSSTTTAATTTSSSTATASTSDSDPVKKRTDEIETEMKRRRAMLAAEYTSGIKDRQQYEQALADVELWGIEQKRNLYSEGTKEYYELDEQLQLKQVDLQKKCSDEELAILTEQTEKAKQLLRQRYIDGELTAEQYEEAVKQIEYEEMQARVQIYAEGTAERQAAEQALTDWLHNDQLARRQEFEKKVADFRTQYLKKTDAELMQAEITFADELYQKKLLSEEEYQKAVAEIKEKYNSKKSSDSDSGEAKQYNLGGTNDWGSAFTNFAQQIGALNTAVESGKAKWQDYASVACASLSIVSTMLTSVSNLMQASADAETAKVEARYDAEIKAAGNNKKKVAKLEAQKEKETQRIKAESNEKAFGLEIAAAIAQTAIAAVSAYASASAIPVVGWVMGPIAAAAAAAAGAIQVATIKKQYEASKANYWTGGYTPSGRWDEAQGTVHSNEFVANRFATQNSELRPVLDLIDNAQRNNTVGSLTSQDVSRVLDTGGTNATQVERNDRQSAQIAASLTAMAATTQRLNQQLDEGIGATVAITGQNGFEKQYNHYKKLTTKQN